MGLLKRKYGNVFVTLDQPISLNSYLEKMGLNRDLLEADERRHLVKALGLSHRPRYHCATVVTSTSLVACVFLGMRKKGIAQNELLNKAKALLEQIKGQDDMRFRIAPELEDNLETHINESIQLFIADKLIVLETINNETFYRPKKGLSGTGLL